MKRSKHAGGVAIHGIVLVTERYAEQVSFYRDELGLEMVDDWGDAARFRSSNGIELTLFARSHDRRSLERLAPATHGLSHLEFSASSEVRRDLEGRLQSSGRVSHGANYLDADGQLFHFVAPPD